MDAAGSGDRAASGPSFRAADVASLLGAELIGDGSVEFCTLGSIERAGPDALTFARSEKYALKWEDSRAAAILVSRRVYEESSKHLRPGNGRAVLVVNDADLAMIALLDLAAKQIIRAPEPGVHPGAAVDESATIGEGVFIGPGASVGPNSAIGARTRLHAGVRVGAGVRIGEDCDLRSNAVVEDRCVLGDRVILQPCAVIGGDGFGYRPASDGSGVIKIPHIGAVELGDDVEIGVNTCVDRGKFSNTVVGRGSKIDNLVQIGHNVVIGRGTVICGCTGIGGSTRVGDGVTIGGACAIHDNITIGDGATLAARSGVMADVPAGEIYGGVPVGPVRDSIKQMASMRYLPDLVRDYKRRMRQGSDEKDDVR